MTDDTIRLRQPDRRRDPRLERPAGEAFAEAFSDAELEQERRLWELDRLIGAVDGETWVGTGGAYSFGLTVPGRRGRCRGDHRDRRHAEPPAARDPAP